MQNLHLHNLHNTCIQMLFLQTRQIQSGFLHYVYDYVFVFDYVFEYVYVFVFEYDYSSNI